MFKIGEFSKIAQVSVRMLRYYDEIGLLKPAQIDDLTGYRLYSIEQIPILQKIILFRDMEFNAAEITAAINNWNNSFIIGQLENKKRQIQDAIQLEQERIAKIEIAIKDVQDEKIAIHYNVSLKSIPSYKILSLRRIIPTYNYEGVLWHELYEFIKREHIELPQGSGNLAIYHNEEHKDGDVDVEVGVTVNMLGKNKAGFVYRETEQIDRMASVMVYGPYENIGAAYQSFAHWLEEHQQYKMVGLSRQICHKGPHNEADPDKYLTEIQTPVVKQI